MNLLILDLETTGLKPSECATIEIGAILYNVEHQQMLQCFSSLLPCQENPVEHINKIPAALTQQKYDSYPFHSAFENMAFQSDAIIAHNASFDRGFINEIEEFKSKESSLQKKPWICTKNDFKWPSRPTRLRLQDICASFHIPYVEAHRSLSDCQLLAKCLSKVSNLKEMIDDILRRK